MDREQSIIFLLSFQCRLFKSCVFLGIIFFINFIKGQIISIVNLLILNILPKKEPKTSALVARAEVDKYLVRFLEESKSRSEMPERGGGQISFWQIS
jgi:hypothetical protein